MSILVLISDFGHNTVGTTTNHPFGTHQMGPDLLFSSAFLFLLLLCLLLLRLLLLFTVLRPPYPPLPHAPPSPHRMNLWVLDPLLLENSKLYSLSSPERCCLYLDVRQPLLGAW